MLTRDYILRMIEQLGIVLSSVLLHRQAKQYDAAMREIETSGERLLGMSWPFLRALPEEQLLEMFGREGAHDKLLAAAELLREESGILDETGREAESVERGFTAFRLFSVLLEQTGESVKEVQIRHFDELLKRLEAYRMPAELQRRRFAFLERSGQFARAENALFDIVEEDPSFIDTGLAFYERLLAKSDGELITGNLTREEVLDGRGALEGKAGYGV